MVFIDIYQIIRFNQNLIIQSFNGIQGMMMPHQKRNSADLFFGKVHPFQKIVNQRRPFFFLHFPFGVSILLPA